MDSNQNKINLSEKDVEDWLWENPDKLIHGYVLRHTVDYWIGRQIRVPSGIIDLLGICKYSGWTGFVVVEVKNVNFSQSAILQVCRYAADIQKIAFDLSIFEGEDNKTKISEYVTKIIIGKGTPDSKLLFEAESVDVQLINFNINYDLSLSGIWQFTDETKEKHNEMIEELKNNQIISKLNDVVVPIEIENFIKSIPDED